MRPETPLETRLRAEVEVLGRPALAFATVPRLRASLSACQAWDLANPDKSAEYRRLVGLLEAETQRADREAAEMVAVERALRATAWKLETSGAGERSLSVAAQARETEALGAVRRWLGTPDCAWLVLCGAKGTGKSVAATWGVREVVRGGDAAAFRRTQTLAKLSQFDAGAVEFEALASCHLLVLDDFGAELLTDYARAQLFELLDRRHEDCARTILTSNLKWQGDDGMAARLGERLVDRIGQSGRVVQLSPLSSMRRGAP